MMENLSAIVNAYLANDGGATEILNDYLEERGRPRCAIESDLDGRLDIVLDNLLPVREAELLACEFAEHVLSVIEADGKDAAQARATLVARREFISGSLGESELYEVAGSALRGAWTSSNPKVLRATWAAWAAAMAKPSNAAAAARAAREGELEWQMQRTKEVLQRVTATNNVWSDDKQ